MHANTFTAEKWKKTRHFEDVLKVSDFAVHRSEGTHPGGVHLELTGDNVTECLGGGSEVVDSDLDDRYETMCDPRLNGSQSVDLALRVAELLRNGQSRTGIRLTFQQSVQVVFNFTLHNSHRCVWCTLPLLSLRYPSTHEALGLASKPFWPCVSFL